MKFLPAETINYLNERGIKTKRGTTLWRGTSIRALIDNPIYKGVLRFGEELSEPFENLRIVDDATYDRCLELVKGRACKPKAEPTVPVQTDSRSLLTGLLFCGECGSRLCYNHNTTRRKLADGTTRVYERDLYRCYRKISSRKSCSGPSGYEMPPLNETVESEVRQFFQNLNSVPADKLVERACSRNAEVLKVAYQQAVEEAKARVEADAKNRKTTEAQVEQFLTLAEKYDKVSFEAKHLIIAALVDRVEVNKNYEVKVFFKVSAKQFLGKVVRIA